MRLALFVTALALLPLTAAAAPLQAECSWTGRISTQDDGFAPFCVNVLSGDRLTWSNDGAVAHQIVTSEPSLLGQGPSPCFTSATYAPGETVSVRVFRDDAGVRIEDENCGLALEPLSALTGESRIQYHCRLHPEMQGQIRVLKIESGNG